MDKEHVEARDDLGQPLGKNPLDLGRDGLLGAGFTEMSPVKAIRANCVACMGGSERTVRDCAAAKCPLWPFRMGKNPWDTRTGRARPEMAEVARVNFRKGSDGRVSHGITPS